MGCPQALVGCNGYPQALSNADERSSDNRQFCLEAKEKLKP